MQEALKIERNYIEICYWFSLRKRSEFIAYDTIFHKEPLYSDR